MFEAFATTPHPQKRFPSWLRITLWSLLGVLILVATFAYVLRIQIVACARLHELAKLDPHVTVVPQELQISPASPAIGEKFQRFGYEASLPWKAVDQRRDLESHSQFFFKDGPVVIFWDPAKAIDNLGLVKGQLNSPQDGEMRASLGPALDSNSTLFNAAMNMQPSRISLLMPRREALRDIMLLPIRWQATMNGTPALISTPVVHGIQVSGASTNAKHTNLILFDSQDRRIEILILTKPNYELKQTDINTIIQSLHPLPQTQPPTETSAHG